MRTEQIALVIILFVIIGSVVFKNCTIILFAAAFLGCLCLYGVAAPSEFSNILVKVVGDNAWLWLVCGLFGGLTELISLGGGVHGFTNCMERICTSRKKTVFMSYILGWILFVDDYLNVLTIGLCMKKIYDKKKIPREVLAFIMNSTAAPVCVLLPFSTWAVFYSNLFFKENTISSAFTSSACAYIQTIPFMFYPIFVLVIVALFSLGLFPKLGNMKKAFVRTESTGLTYSEESRKYNPENDDYDFHKKGKVIDFILPILVLILVCIFTCDFIVAVLSAIVLSAVMSLVERIATSEMIVCALVKGFGSMMPVFFMLVGAFSLETVCDEMQLPEYLLELVRPFMGAEVFPAIAFVLLGIIAFATGSNWGMSALMVPILVPIGSALGCNLILLMAAIVSGGVFGSHACFYTDATILAAKSAGIGNMEHALSQFPYVLIAAALTVVSFAICGFIF